MLLPTLLAARPCRILAGGSTQAERLARATERLNASAPAKIEVIKKLNREYVALKRSDPTHPRLRKLEVQIENLDTQLRLITRPAEVLIGVVYYYYRARMDSVGTGLALGIKPPAVRQTLRRLRRTWERMRASTPTEVQITSVLRR